MSTQYRPKPSKSSDLIRQFKAAMSEPEPAKAPEPVCNASCPGGPSCEGCKLINALQAYLRARGRRIVQIITTDLEE